MYFTSQICTTKEQSNRLLALGLKKETADMVYKPHSHYPDEVINYYEATPMVEQLRKYIIADDIDFRYYIPAWSLHRLIEMAQLPQYWQCVSGDWYNEVIAHIQSMIHINEFNKEYLEERV